MEINWDVSTVAKREPSPSPEGLDIERLEVFSPSLIMIMQPKAAASGNLSRAGSDDVFMSFAVLGHKSSHQGLWIYT